jgi:predicted N-formylglutamate amidohydrolase
MKADYFEVFENGSYRPLHFGFVYDLETRTASQLIELGLADPLEKELILADNKKEASDVKKPKRRASKSKKSGSDNGSGDSPGVSRRTKKRVEN